MGRADRCCVCKSTRTKNPDLRFYTLPQHPVRRDLWLRAIRQVLSPNPSQPWMPKKRSKLCSRHFVNGIVSKTNIPTRLGYVPTIFNLEEVDTTQVQVVSVRDIRNRQPGPAESAQANLVTPNSIVKILTPKSALPLKVVTVKSTSQVSNTTESIVHPLPSSNVGRPTIHYGHDHDYIKTGEERSVDMEEALGTPAAKTLKLANSTKVVTPISATPAKVVTQKSATPVRVVTPLSLTPAISQKSATPVRVVTQKSATPFGVVTQKSATPFGVVTQKSATPFGVVTQKPATPFRVVTQKSFTPIRVITPLSLTPVKVVTQKSSTPANVVTRLSATPAKVVTQKSATPFKVVTQKSATPFRVVTPISATPAKVVTQKSATPVKVIIVKSARPVRVNTLESATSAKVSTLKTVQPYALHKSAMPTKAAVKGGKGLSKEDSQRYEVPHDRLDQHIEDICKQHSVNLIVTNTGKRMFKEADGSVCLALEKVFMCHRSGAPTRKRTIDRKRQASKKVGCAFRFKAVVPLDTNMPVKIYLQNCTHSNHTPGSTEDQRWLPVDQRVVNIAADSLTAGLSIQETFGIIENALSSGTIGEIDKCRYRALPTRKELSDWKRKRGHKPRKSSDSDCDIHSIDVQDVEVMVDPHLGGNTSMRDQLKSHLAKAKEAVSQVDSSVDQMTKHERQQTIDVVDTFLYNLRQVGLPRNL